MSLVTGLFVRVLQSLEDFTTVRALGEVRRRERDANEGRIMEGPPWKPRNPKRENNKSASSSGGTSGHSIEVEGRVL